MYTDEETRNLTAAKNFTELYRRDSAAAYRTYCTPDVHWVDMPNALGPGGLVLRSAEELAAGVDVRDQLVTAVEGGLVRIAADGGSVIVQNEWTFRLKNGGAWDLDIVNWFTFRDGLITEATAFVSPKPTTDLNQTFDL